MIKMVLCGQVIRGVTVVGCFEGHMAIMADAEYHTAGEASQEKEAEDTSRTGCLRRLHRFRQNHRLFEYAF